MKNGPLLPISELLKAKHYFVTFFVLALVPAVLGPTLSGLARQTGVSLSDTGLLFAMRSLGYLCTARLIGAVFDRWPGHPVMAGALCCTAVMACAVTFAGAFWLAALLVLGMGISSAFVDLGGNILLMRAFRRRPGPVLNGLHFSFGLGAFAAPLLVALALWWTGDPVDAYWMIALLSLPAAGWLLRVPAPPPPEIGWKRETSPSVRPKSLFFIVAFFFLYGGAEIGFGGWIHTYGVGRNAMDDAEAAFLTSAFWGSFTMGRLLAIPLAQRLRPRTLLVWQCAGCIAALSALLLAPPATATTWGCTVLIGLGMSSIFPLMLAFLEPITAGSGRLTSWYFIGASSGSLIIPWVIGQFIETPGPQVFVLAELVCLTLSAGLLRFLIRTP